MDTAFSLKDQKVQKRCIGDQKWVQTSLKIAKILAWQSAGNHAVTSAVITGGCVSDLDSARGMW